MKHYVSVPTVVFIVIVCYYVQVCMHSWILIESLHYNHTNNNVILFRQFLLNYWLIGCLVFNATFDVFQLNRGVNKLYILHLSILLKIPHLELFKRSMAWILLLWFFKIIVFVWIGNKKKNTRTLHGIFKLYLIRTLVNIW
jgi:hypothetical protein